MLNEEGHKQEIKGHNGVQKHVARIIRDTNKMGDNRLTRKMGQLKGDPKNWGADQQKEQTTESIDQKTDEEQDEEPDVNTTRDRTNQQQRADQQLEEEEMQLQEMMTHTIQDTGDTTDARTQTIQQQEEEQRNKEEEMLLHAIIDQEQLKTTEGMPQNPREQHATGTKQGISKPTTNEQEAQIVEEPEPTGDANNSVQEEANEFMMEVNRIAERVETERRATEQPEQQQGIHGFFLGQLGIFKQNTTNTSGTKNEEMEPTTSDEQKAAQEFMAEINKLAEEAETKDEETQDTRKRGTLETPP